MFEHGVEWFGPVCTKNITVAPTVTGSATPANPPDPTNASAVCSPLGTSATVAWTAPSGYSTFYMRAKLYPNPADGSAIVWDDNATGTSYTFATQPGKTYEWWAQTRDPKTGAASSGAAGTTFTCQGPQISSPNKNVTP